MLDIEITFRNYRCFGYEPAKIRISDGFTALIGINNSGKTSLLRAFYELRNFFRYLAGGNLVAGGSITIGGFGGFVAPTGERLWRTGTDRPIELDFVVRDGPSGPFVVGGQATALSATFNVNNGQVIVALKNARGNALALDNEGNTGTQIESAPIASVMDVLARAMYIGPFRNAINVGANEAYYDIQTGE